MTDNEYKYGRLVQVKNVVIVLATAGLVGWLYSVSQSFYSMFALFMLVFISGIQTDDADET